jgi:hypothetical protein
VSPSWKNPVFAEAEVVGEMEDEFGKDFRIAPLDLKCFVDVAVVVVVDSGIV